MHMLEIPIAINGQSKGRNGPFCAENVAGVSTWLTLLTGTLVGLGQAFFSQIRGRVYDSS